MNQRWNKLSSTRYTLAIIAFLVFSGGAAILIALGLYPQIQMKLIDWAGYVVLAYLGLRTFRGATYTLSGIFKGKQQSNEQYDKEID